MAEGPASGKPAGNKDKERIHTVKELLDAEIEHTVCCWAVQHVINLHDLLDKTKRFGEKSQNPNPVKQLKAKRELMRKCSALEMKLKDLKSKDIDVAKFVGARFPKHLALAKYQQVKNVSDSDNSSSVMSSSDDDIQTVINSETGSQNNLFTDSDNQNVTVSHDNQNVTVSHDNQNVTVSHDNQNVTVSHDCNETQNTGNNSDDDSSNQATDKSTQTITTATDKSTQTTTIESDNESGDGNQTASSSDKMFRSSAISMLSSLSLGSDSVFINDEDADI